MPIHDWPIETPLNYRRQRRESRHDRRCGRLVVAVSECARKASVHNLIAKLERHLPLTPNLTLSIPASTRTSRAGIVGLIRTRLLELLLSGCERLHLAHQHVNPRPQLRLPIPR